MRLFFAVLLILVDERPDANDDAEDEQMEVILRFLKLAAANFDPSHAFKIVTPRYARE